MNSNPTSTSTPTLTATPMSRLMPAVVPGAASPGAASGATGSKKLWIFGIGALLVGGALGAAIVASPLLRGGGDAAAASTAVAPAADGAQKAVPAPQRAAAPARAVADCANCGTVESVVAVQQKGEGTGVGAVAGGLLGGVVGNQIGGGSGKTAATVIGAVGGGVAGHELEKRARSTTSFQVRVRMDDGTTRTVTQRQSAAVGSRVNVTSEGLKALPAGS